MSLNYSHIYCLKSQFDYNQTSILIVRLFFPPLIISLWSMTVGSPKGDFEEWDFGPDLHFQTSPLGAWGGKSLLLLFEQTIFILETLLLPQCNFEFNYGFYSYKVQNSLFALQ